MIKRFIISKLKSLIAQEIAPSANPFAHLDCNVIELNNYKELMKIFKWDKEPNINRPDIYDFEYLEDANERRIRDAESIATVIRNHKSDTIVEIGTSTGMGTILLAENAPESKIYTINIPPEEIISGEGGIATTIALETEKIGIEYKKRGYKNIEQIYINTSKWEPEMSNIDAIFIDGCHDTWFVHNDTKRALPKMKSGSFILWHDFNLDLTKKYSWINDVCLGVEQLYREGVLKGRIYHIRDSWIGIYQVP